MLFKIFLTMIAIGISVFSGIILSVSSHGNPEMMLSMLFISTFVAIAAGFSLYVIWYH